MSEVAKEKGKNGPGLFGKAFIQGLGYGAVALVVMIVGDIAHAVITKPAVNSLEGLMGRKSND